MKFSAIPLACALLCGASVSAQTQLPTQVVTATRVLTPVTQVIADVSVIDRAALELAGQSSLRDVLATQPGVQLSSNGSYRSNTGVFLRGAASSQAIVMIDGVRVGSATSGMAALENIPLERIERIEILRGASSALYGADAVGGVIQIFTRLPERGTASEFRIGSGSDGQQQISASARGGSERFAYSLGVSREKATGISVLVPAAGNYNPDEDGFTATSMDARFTTVLNRQHALTLALLRSQTDYQFDGKPFPNPLALTALTTDAWTKTTLNHASLKWDAQWSERWKSTFTLGGSEDQSVQEYYRTSDNQLGGSSQFNTLRKQATWQNDVRFGKDVLTVLLENRNETIDSTTAYTVTSRDVRSAMASYAWNTEEWNALFIARKDENSQFGHFNNWSAAGGYRITPAFRFVGSIGTSFQAPTFNQLYYPGYGNTALQPQQNRATEWGFKYQEGLFSGSALVYRNDIQGFILPATNVQSSKALLQGVTLAGEWKSDDILYSLSYDYADPRSYSTSAAANDLRLVRIAQHTVNARTTQTVGNAQVFAELRYSGDREDNNLNFTGRDTLPSYTLLNLGVNWKMRKGFSILARVNNVTDASYQLANGYAMPGRNFLVSLNWTQ